jgi:type IV secretory pathway TrbD component
MSVETELPGFQVPVHRALTEPILLGGAPRAVAIVNGTLAAAIGLGLQRWLAARRDPRFLEVIRRHIRYPAHLQV